MQKTYMARKEDVQRNWHLVDAKGVILGNIATQVAQKLIGKHKKDFTPHVDSGDYVVVINAAEFIVTGNNKLQDKKYYTHSGYMGGLKTKTLGELMEKTPEKVIEAAVYNMLPKNKHRAERMNRLKVHAGAEHEYESQLKKAQ
jgi:large subunit ribosomal protein L13